MRPSFKDYFYFNSTERKGIYILISVILMLIFGNYLIDYFQIDGKPQKTEEELYSLLSQLESETVKQNTQNSDTATYKNHSVDQTKPSYFNFNPNNLSLKKWMQLGLSRKQAAVIKKYEQAGGSFKVKADLAKMYTISEARYRALKPYILLPDTIAKPVSTHSKEKVKSKQKYSSKKWKRHIVDINTADSMTLLKVYGIGPFFSGKIVAHRENLGGYHDKRQLLDIWHFSDSMLQALDSNLKMTQVNLKKLNINSNSAEELQKHPYINWNIANSIVNFRKQHGAYQKLQDLQQSVLITDSIYLKIQPYLSVE